MLNEAFKKQFLSSHELFSKKRWEGKPWSFKMKYFYANYPEMFFSTALMLVVLPAIYAYKMKTFEGSAEDALKKYRYFYKVVRDDHPNIKKILEEKELGRQYFPKY